MAKKERKKKEKKEEEKKTKVVNVNVRDVLEFAEKVVVSENGGIGTAEVEFLEVERIGDSHYFKFRIPDMSEKGKCNQICPPGSEGCDEDEGCGDTGGACICGKKNGHEGVCECKLCGHEF